MSVSHSERENGLSDFLKNHTKAQEYYRTLPGFVREKLERSANPVQTEQDFYKMAERFLEE